MRSQSVFVCAAVDQGGARERQECKQSRSEPADL